MTHEQFLLAALQQAQLGQGRCAPNPSVGAVAVQNGAIIAQAHHQGAGTPHAEQLLLAQIPAKTPGLTVYSTLEPCSHWGKTPPCVDVITEHGGVEKVFFAYLDPNPLVARNNSSEKLRAHGIEVVHLPIKAIDSFYQSYAYWTKTKRPRLTVKMAQSLDGKIAYTEGDRLILSNDRCAEWTHQMRAKSDLILTSARTIHRDNPQLNVRLEGATLKKPVAIIDRTLSLNQDAQVFSTAQHCHLYHHAINQPIYPNTSLHHLPLSNGKLDLNALLGHIGQLGYHDVFAEVGGTLFTALHQQGLVHRTYLYLAPKVLGVEGISAYQSSDLFHQPHSLSWQSLGDNALACFDWKEDTCLLVS